MADDRDRSFAPDDPSSLASAPDRRSPAAAGARGCPPAPVRQRSVEAILSTFPAEFIVDPAVQAEARRALRERAPWIIIPSARITGRRALDRILAKFGRQIALQDDPLPGFRAALRAAGFQVESGWVTLPRSEVMRIVARRTSKQLPEGGG